jgi:predicted MPP superfamily phosphohydrolase
MNWPDPLLLAVVLCVGWIGHACLWVSVLSHLYGRPLPKSLLKLWRLVTGLIIVGFPLPFAMLGQAAQVLSDAPDGPAAFAGLATVTGCLILYLSLCVLLGAGVFPAVTVIRYRRPLPPCVVRYTQHTRDLWSELGDELIGDGHLATVTRLPGNGVFRVDFTDLTLALPQLPPELDGLTLLVASDFHFHGTPSRGFFERVLDELLAAPPPDLVCLLGDFVDSDTHHQWLVPLLGRLRATQAKFAILGNHDTYHQPERVRAELAAAGYTVLGPGWHDVTLRGVPCGVVGHEGPWLAAPAAKPSAAAYPFSLCLSHTPDNFYWGIANGINLMLCGHVHGGGIRLPLVGSIFVPSIYGRRFDQGVFEQHGTVMVVNRGLSGREPLRIRCNPEVLRVKLIRPSDSPPARQL